VSETFRQDNFSKNNFTRAFKFKSDDIAFDEVLLGRDLFAVFADVSQA